MTESITTVSYTHLDVYKRQSWEIEEEHGNNWMVTAWQPLPKPYNQVKERIK